MGKNKVLVKAHPEGKYVVDIDKDIDVAKLTTGARVALKNDSYTLHLLLPTKVDPLVSLMKVENVPDSTYDMIGGADEQIKEIKEVCVPVCGEARWEGRRGEGKAKQRVLRLICSPCLSTPAQYYRLFQICAEN